MNDKILNDSRILSKVFKAEKETRHTESFYRLHFESAIIGMMILDAETGKVLDVNPFLVDLLGLTKKDIIDKEIWKIAFFKKIFEDRKNFNKIFQVESIYYKDILLDTINGQQIDVELLCNVVFVEQKKIIQCSIKDITKRKQVEIAMRNNELHLQTLMQAIPELIWSKDTKGVYLSCNAMFERFFGAIEADIIGKTDYDFVAKDIADTFLENDRKVMTSGKSITNKEWITFADNGKRTYLETIKTPMFDSKGVLFGVLGIGRDFTENKKLEVSLIESEEIFKSIYESSNDAIMLLNENGYFDCNQRALKIFGIKSKEEFVKLNLYDLSPTKQPDGRNSKKVADEYIRIAYEKGSENFEWYHLRSNGELFPTKVFLSVFFLKGDRVLQVTVRDLSQKEQELIIANKELAFQDKEKVKRAAELSIANTELVFQNEEKEKRAAELIIANTELAFQNEEKENRAAELIIADKELDYQNVEKGKRAAELIIANKELAYQSKEKEDRAAELIIANKELIFQDGEKENRAAELDIANIELDFQNEEKEKRAAELLIANRELAFQNEEKEKRAAELIIANTELAFQNQEKEKRAAELGIANTELLFQNNEKEKRAAELGIANAELVFQNEEKEKRAAELGIANAELAFQNEEKEKRAAELIVANTELAYQNEEKEKRAAELIIANTELAFQNEEKEKRAAELGVANTELLFQNNEKEKRAAELIIANTELAFQNEEKEKRAAELGVANTELLFQNEEKEKRAAELSIANAELLFQNREKEKRAAELIIAKENAEESDKLKTAFLQNMSHEIRTPLNGIIGFSSLLNDEDISKEEIKEFTSMISQSGKRLIEIVNNVLDISKIQTGQIEVKHTSMLINSIFSDLFTFFSPIAIAKNIFLSYNNQNDKFRTLFTDEAKLHQILTNLINNAIKFTKSGNIDFGYEIKNNLIQLYVKDTGIGLPKESFERIFDRFIQVEQTMTKNYEGAGLGLAISKGLVELLGGKIWVESEIGKGTTFFFTLPYIKGEEQPIAEAGSMEIPGKLSRGKILIAEDDWTSFQYLKRILIKKDINVIHVENGEEAITSVKNNPDINLILMDIRMPVMDGIEATKQIKLLRPDLPIIAQTAYAFEDEKTKILAIGCDEYLAKPIDNAKLTLLINKYLI